MERTVHSEEPLVQVFQALGDENRWKILTAVAAAGELPCRDLESILPVSKATISYHARLLTQAGLITVRKQGRSSFYTLDAETMRHVLATLTRLRPDSAADPGAGRRTRTPVRSTLPDEAIALTTW
ncbi:metalloregulator ArsR/SmtB family transcription factor [Rhodococcus sp. CSLK01-03]|uniref:Metalloregulator ArsR/SmtB family transcription factor n=1 Tax=Rhodococcus indonesiensis TaxID=3055869 RepID=A0ABT7RNX7_9NOCA|nr:metalloregulator ArsR/SmtB family transcription factor [Rhodococcus indonesiensis]MDM7489345.1 metalloregulator ArsR/SmtB family transcription factor [Rhodococcus indonesiensis]